jgi:hypothetical protein
VATCLRTRDTGRFVRQTMGWWTGGGEELCDNNIKSYVWPLRSIRAHLERFRIVGDPICVCVCMVNYETVSHIIWKCSWFENKRRQLLLGLADVNVIQYFFSFWFSILFSTTQLSHNFCGFVRWSLILYFLLLFHHHWTMQEVLLKPQWLYVFLDGWIKKGGATPDRSRTPARGPLFGPNVLP